MGKNKPIEFEFHILMGLPGSGKTYWAVHNYPTNYWCNHTGRMIVDLDKYKDKDKNDWVDLALNEEFKNYMEHLYICEDKKIDVCIDGPLTSYSHLERVVEDIIMYINRYCKWRKYADYKLSFIIHQWDENREYCLYNDKKRNREIGAAASIMYFEYTKIDDNFLKVLKRHIENLSLKFSPPININRIEKIEHMVKKTTTYEQIFEPLCDNIYGHGGDEQGRYLYSEEWSLGGEWGDCWGNHGHVSGSESKDFIELDDLLEKIAPQISFIQYKKIKNHCVEQIEWHVPDYYSSGMDEACWRCDMRKLYEMLKEMNYIED